MVNWKITAATIFCEDVDDEVTLLVFKDGTVKCVASQKYSRSDKETSRALREKSRKLKRPLACKGSACPRPADYRDRLMAEEAQQK